MSAGRLSFFAWAQQEEQRGNRDGREDGALYAQHRIRATAAILSVAPPGSGRLALLGAGNAHDLDLTALAAAFEEIHLVDIDPAALARASGRQSPAVQRKLHAHAPVDLSGLYQAIEDRRRPVSPGTVTALVDEAAARVLGQLPPRFDLVASCCVLTQMTWALGAFAEGDPALAVALQQAAVAVHLRTLLALVPPGRRALLITDAVSSSVYPVDQLEPGTDLRGLLDRLTEQSLLFQTANPVNVRRTLRRDPFLLARCGSAELGEPWLWTGPRTLTYLVYPMVLTRKEASVRLDGRPD
jgi:hypothetical protein